MKFEVGDKVLITKKLTVGGMQDYLEIVGRIVTVTNVNSAWFDFASSEINDTVFIQDYDKVQLITKENNMARRTFRLLKETPDGY